MKKIKMTEELEKFLRKEKALTKFKKNCPISEDVIYDNISSSFVWRLTPEGDIFWRQLNMKFIQSWQKEKLKK
ncbi:MAG: hypothetical protein ACOC2U_03570 [bacterium]